jgi:hypothetical protein
MNVVELQHECGHVILVEISLALNIYIADINTCTHHLINANLQLHK